MGNFFGDVFDSLTGRGTTKSETAAAENANAAMVKSIEIAIQAQRDALERLIGLQQPFYNAGLSALPYLQSAITGQPAAVQTGPGQPPGWATGASSKYGGLSAQQITRMATGLEPNPQGFTIADAIAAGKESMAAGATNNSTGQMVNYQLPGQQTAADIPQLSKFVPQTLDVNDPEYKYRMSQGNINLGRALAARRLQGGGTAPLQLAQLQDSIGADQWGKQYQRGMDSYNAAVKGYGLGNDLANTQYSRLAGLAGLGTGSAGAMGSGVANTGNQLASLYSDLGTNQANNSLYQGQIGARASQNLGNLVKNGMQGSQGGLQALMAFM